MIVLDTNVISELSRPDPAESVLVWLASLDAAGERVCITSITVGELGYGLAKLPSGKRRDALAHVTKVILARFADASVLAYGRAAADLVGEVIVTRQRAARPIALADAQIAAICLSVGATLATRNTADFLGLGLALINPWSEPG